MYLKGNKQLVLHAIDFWFLALAMIWLAKCVTGMVEDSHRAKEYLSL